MEPLKLFVWFDVLSDYTSGIAFALASNENDARELIVNRYKKEEVLPDIPFDSGDEYRIRRELSKEPEVFTDAAGFYCNGGG